MIRGVVEAEKAIKRRFGTSTAAHTHVHIPIRYYIESELFSYKAIFAATSSHPQTSGHICTYVCMYVSVCYAPFIVTCSEVMNERLTQRCLIVDISL